MEMEKTYNPQAIENDLYKAWEESGAFTAHRVEGKKPFTIVMPPPNVTGQLHMGHALDNTLQDILIRYKRMSGFRTLWLPATCKRVVGYYKHIVLLINGYSSSSAYGMDACAPTRVTDMAD